jgi:hypothetical protein
LIEKSLARFHICDRAVNENIMQKTIQMDLFIARLLVIATLFLEHLQRRIYSFKWLERDANHTLWVIRGQRQ